MLIRKKFPLHKWKNEEGKLSHLVCINYTSWSDDAAIHLGNISHKETVTADRIRSDGLDSSKKNAFSRPLHRI